ncbi:hypothetical protein DSO57_1024482 [Entomophthora muscae]|uniref:Uncharacterized protein n=1 Tax=Entomophthora muscae TaxID=34485 RepID=A0ACC2TPU1_9FUNG|nr:hypothetical protein DSO57_1024482 [Entomophthora muscae]
MKLLKFGLVFSLSTLGWKAPSSVLPASHLDPEARLPSNLVRRADGDKDATTQGDEEIPESDYRDELNVGGVHKHFIYRNFPGEYIAARNYIGLFLVLIAGAIGCSAHLLFGKQMSIRMRSFTTGVLLSTTICQLTIASNIILQENPLPETLSHFISGPSCLMMLGMCLVHLLDLFYFKKQAINSCIFVFVALTIHAANFGISLGMRRDANFPYLIAATVQHFLYGLALGMCIVDASFSSTRGPAAMMVTFVVACPITTTIGISLKDMQRNSPHILIEGISEGVASGFLFFVVLVTLMSRAFSSDYTQASPSEKISAFAWLYAGTLSIAAVTIFCF